MTIEFCVTSVICFHKMAPPPSVFRPDLFAGKTAVVTGGGTGIGYQVARELLSLGCNVYICSRSQAKLDAAVDSLAMGSRAGRIHAMPCNIRKEDDVQAFVAHVVAKAGRIDHLVNCAGGQFISEAGSLSSKGFKAVVELNLVGVFLMCREVFTQSMSEHGGSIVNITMVTHNGLPRMAHSGAARAGVDNLTKSLAMEWASAGVRVNTVSPGVIFTRSGFENYGAMGQTSAWAAVKSCAPVPRDSLVGACALLARQCSKRWGPPSLSNALALRRRYRQPPSSCSPRARRTQAARPSWSTARSAWLATPSRWRTPAKRAISQSTATRRSYQRRRC